MSGHIQTEQLPQMEVAPEKNPSSEVDGAPEIQSGPECGSSTEIQSGPECGPSSEIQTGPECGPSSESPTGPAEARSNRPCYPAHYQPPLNREIYPCPLGDNLYNFEQLTAAGYIDTSYMYKLMKSMSDEIRSLRQYANRIELLLAKQQPNSSKAKRNPPTRCWSRKTQQKTPEADGAQAANQESSVQRGVPYKFPVPPIVIMEPVADPIMFGRQLSQLTNEFHFASRREGLYIQPYSRDAHQKLSESPLITKKRHHLIKPSPVNDIVKAVIKGLPHQIKFTDIAEELRANGIVVTDLEQMVSLRPERFHERLPLYLVTTTSTMEELQKVSHIGFFRVRFEPPHYY